MAGGNVQKSLLMLRKCVNQQSKALLQAGGLLMSPTRSLTEIHTPEGIQEPPIPQYTPRENESVEVRRARLLYQSRKRGMTENGLLLSTFAAKFLDGFNEKELKVYDKLINEPSNDWELYYWVTEAKPTPVEYESEVLNLLKIHTKNVNKDARSIQPDLY